MQKNFVRYIQYLLIVSIGMFSLCAVLIVLVDPYGEFGAPRFNMRTFSANPLVTYDHREKLRTGRYYLVFGTSRSSFISSDFFLDESLNFHALYGNPRSIDEFLKSLDQKQIKNILGIFFLVDIHVFDSKTYISSATYLNLHERLIYRAQNLSQYLFQSLKKIQNNYTKSFDGYVHPNGYDVLVKRLEQCRIPVKRTLDSVVDIGKKEMTALENIRAFTDRNNIHSVFASPSFFESFLDSLDKEKLLAQKQVLIKILGSYHDFVFYDGPITDCKFYMNPDHLNKEGVEEYMRLIRSESYLTNVAQPVDRRSHPSTSISIER